MCPVCGGFVGHPFENWAPKWHLPTAPTLSCLALARRELSGGRAGLWLILSRSQWLLWCRHRADIDTLWAFRNRRLSSHTFSFPLYQRGDRTNLGPLSISTTDTRQTELILSLSQGPTGPKPIELPCALLCPDPPSKAGGHPPPQVPRQGLAASLGHPRGQCQGAPLHSPFLRGIAVLRGDRAKTQ